jgi:hypothetical protein
VLVATDLLARGIHVDDISMVVHFSLPDSLAIYLHRAGRTARAGRSGRSVVLLSDSEKDERKFKKLETSFAFETVYEGQGPTEFAKSAVERLMAKIKSVASDDKSIIARHIKEFPDEVLDKIFINAFLRLGESEIPKLINKHSLISGRKNFVTLEIADVGFSRFPTPAQASASVVNITEDGDVRVVAGENKWYVDVKKEAAIKLLENEDLHFSISSCFAEMKKKEETRTIRSYRR